MANKRSDTPVKYPAEIRDLVARLAAPDTPIKERRAALAASEAKPAPARDLQRQIYRYCGAVERTADGPPGGDIYKEYAAARAAVRTFRQSYVLDARDPCTLVIRPRSDSINARNAGALLDALFTESLPEGNPGPHIDIREGSFASLYNENSSLPPLDERGHTK